MGIFQESYTWCNDLIPGEWAPWSTSAWEEFLCAALLLPLAASNIRLPVGTTLSATDATLVLGGGAETKVPEGLAKKLYTFGEHVGFGARLDQDPEDQDLPAPPGEVQEKLHSLVESLQFKVTRRFRFSKTSHVNLQEARAVKAEVKSWVTRENGRSEDSTS
jgi:hypothetical protein